MCTDGSDRIRICNPVRVTNGYEQIFFVVSIFRRNRISQFHECSWRITTVLDSTVVNIAFRERKNARYKILVG